MITVKEIKEKALRQYNAFLRSLLEIVSSPIADVADQDNLYTHEFKNFFPLEIRADKGKVTDNIKTRAAELKDIIAHSKNRTSLGYTIETQQIVTRNNGIQTSIKRIFFETEKDYVTFIEKEAPTKRFMHAVETLTATLPACIPVKTWAILHLTELCGDHAHCNRKDRSKNDKSYWHDIALCVSWLHDNPRSNRYIREIPLPVHTKFIENNKTIIESLLLCATQHQSEQDNTTFEGRFGLKTKPNLFRCRPLCANLSYIANLPFPEQLSLTVPDLELFFSSEIEQTIKNVFIIENEMVFLSFPQVPDSFCIWGHGYDVLCLRECQSLKSRRIIYSGDIDEHGFDIISKLRTHFPCAETFCMDAETYNAFKPFAVQGNTLSGNATPQNLSGDEQSLFAVIRADTLRNRLEQERFTHEYIIKRLADLGL